MPTIKYKPTTPARRNMTVPSFDEITKFSPEKSLIVTKKKHAGRNNLGRITVRHHGGGNKVKYRIIDFKRSDASANTVNVYDVLNANKFVVSKAAIAKLEEVFA